MAPIFEKLADNRHGQFARAKLSHKSAIVDLFVPCLVKRGVKIIHIGFGFVSGKSFSWLRCFRLRHFKPPDEWVILRFSSRLSSVLYAVKVTDQVFDQNRSRAYPERLVEDH